MRFAQRKKCIFLNIGILWVFTHFFTLNFSGRPRSAHVAVIKNFRSLLMSGLSGFVSGTSKFHLPLVHLVP